MKLLPLNGAAAALVFTASAAWAEITPQEIWNDWKAYLEGFGYSVEAGESTSGGTLSLKDLVLRVDLPENEGTMSMSFGPLELTETGDGGVEIVLPPSLPIEVAVAAANGETFEATLLNSYDELEMIVTGAPGDMLYTYSAARGAISLDSLVVEGRAVPVEKAELTLETLAGSASMKTGDLRVSAQEATAGRISYDIDFTSTDAEEPGRFQAKGMVSDFSARATSRLPREMDPENMGAMLDAGFGFDGSLSYGSGQSALTVESEEDTVAMSSSSSGSKLAFALDRETLSYSGNAKGLNNSIQSAEFPFPIEFRIEDLGFNLMAPLTGSDEPRDFALAITLGDFSMSEMLWSLFDPEGKLSHDPATIAFDLAGKVKLLIDPFDPVQVQSVEAGETMPAELHEVSLNALTISAAGAELTGDGAFTFNNDDLTTFNGMPAPQGAVDLRIVGANALLDQLVAMGLLPEDQVMGVRMMMGLFAVPGDGEDVLTSKIEVRENGQVLANGQRIK